jgi:hypothetical protein
MPIISYPFNYPYMQQAQWAHVHESMYLQRVRVGVKQIWSESMKSSTTCDNMARMYGLCLIVVLLYILKGISWFEGKIWWCWSTKSKADKLLTKNSRYDVQYVSMDVRSFPSENENIASKCRIDRVMTPSLMYDQKTRDQRCIRPTCTNPTPYQIYLALDNQTSRGTIYCDVDWSTCTTS